MESDTPHRLVGLVYCLAHARVHDTAPRPDCSPHDHRAVYVGLREDDHAPLSVKG